MKGRVERLEVAVTRAVAARAELTEAEREVRNARKALLEAYAAAAQGGAS